MAKEDTFGDRMKGYERHETDRKFIPTLPVYVRLDGRGFSKFTKKMVRPYDERLIDLMRDTTEHLVSEFKATVGYVQSDEISLVFENTPENPILFNGKIQKIVSTLAATASTYFMANFYTHFKASPLDFCDRLPSFDCRAFNLPSWSEASNAILWRHLDAMKNSKQMLAQHHFEHKELQGLNGQQLVEKLHDNGVEWEDQPEYFKYGLIIKRHIHAISSSLSIDPIFRTFVHPIREDVPFYKLPYEKRVALTYDLIHEN